MDTLAKPPFIHAEELDQAEAAGGAELSTTSLPSKFERPVRSSPAPGVIGAFQSVYCDSGQNLRATEPLHRPGGFGFRLVVKR